VGLLRRHEMGGYLRRIDLTPDGNAGTHLTI
jgi:hypothetical protein